LLEGSRIGHKVGVAVCARLEGVTKTFGPVRALVGVTLEVAFGVTTVIEGPNGSGKSTLLGILGTLSRPTSGFVDHSALGTTLEAIRTSIGWVGHESLCYGDLSGRENIELAARLQGKDPMRAFEAARARFDLGVFAERLVRTYSRGQKQKIALARAVVHAPKLLLLDEPTSGLDAAAQARLVDLVKEEAARDAAVVVVTHDAGFAEAVDGVRHRMERGRLLA
jgi:heme exporter protein A